MDCFKNKSLVTTDTSITFDRDLSDEDCDPMEDSFSADPNEMQNDQDDNPTYPPAPGPCVFQPSNYNHSNPSHDFVKPVLQLLMLVQFYLCNSDPWLLHLLQ